MAKQHRHIGNPKAEYSSKLKTAEDAVKVVKSGDRIMYGEFLCVPIACDEELAKRKEELRDVWVLTNTLTFIPKISLADPSHEHFLHNDLSFSIIARKLADAGLCYHIPCAYNGAYRMLAQAKDSPNVAVIAACPMDENGYFNFGPVSSLHPLLIDLADHVIVEVNKSLPRVYGGSQYAVHISQVDTVVEGPSLPLLQIPKPECKDEDNRIAQHIMNKLEDGVCIQLGIGGMPNRVGELISESDLKDIGVHTEMLVDSFVDMYEAGRITNKKKNIDRGQFVFTFAMGSDKLYNFINENPLCNIMPPTYTNDPYVIGQNEKAVSICSCLEVDLFGQVSSESKGPRQISGTGGQFDFIYGAYRSEGGMGFLCMNSTATDKNGNRVSRIVPGLAPATTVTVPRHASHYIVTENGIADMKGRATWQRAEALIEIADPEFQDDLVKQAEDMKIWKKSNKI